MYSKFPGLQTEQLYQGRDLAITTDFREVLIPFIERHLSLNQAQVANLFPGYTWAQSVPVV